MNKNNSLNHLEVPPIAELCIRRGTNSLEVLGNFVSRLYTPNSKPLRDVSAIRTERLVKLSNGNRSYGNYILIRLFPQSTREKVREAREPRPLATVQDGRTSLGDIPFATPYNWNDLHNRTRPTSTHSAQKSCRNGSVSRSISYQFFCYFFLFPG